MAGPDTVPTMAVATSTASARTSGRDASPHLSGVIGGIGALGLVLVLWLLASKLLDVPEYVLPSPDAVLESGMTYRASLMEHALVTLREVLIGFGLAAVGGTLLATLMTFNRVIGALCEPLLVASNAVPKVAIAPVLVVWFGFGATTNAVIAFSLAVFPMTINVAAGLRAIDPDFVSLGRVMGGNAIRIFALIRLPDAAPYTFAGLKLAMTTATVGAVVGEFVAANAGLGYLAQQASGTLNTALAFAALIVLAALGIALYAVIVLIERLVRHDT